MSYQSSEKIKNPIFMAGVPGVKPVQDLAKVVKIQKKVQELCKWEGNGFPGSQPVSMDHNNLIQFKIRPYKVSWNANGTRFMMFIRANKEIFFINRNNSVYEVSGLTFPHYKDFSRTLNDTLLDGEMVIDKVDGKNYPRYLVHDIIMCDGRDVSTDLFFIERYNIIEKEVIGSRIRALKESRIHRDQEPFSIRQKQFWDITQVNKLLSEKFVKQLGHEPDGLIFQPSKEPYIPGPAAIVLKWKPLSSNSVDFMLRIFVESGMGTSPKKIGHLYVEGLEEPFGFIKITKQIQQFDNKIIECTYNNGTWLFMRERTDKFFPNSFITVRSVLNSIIRPITSQHLIHYIDKNQFNEDWEDCMPPAKRRR
ncbi:mRNA-capping enzyme-like [Chelonus insularis]|uniref:mRNA-capping enzyme-like n=1 Tax=Chelonus insularis TaxID=460826 RepID=UPI00158CEA74|nr:mRNA-capping enzyme-like [Chelonus insularis]